MGRRNINKENMSMKQYKELLMQIQNKPIIIYGAHLVAIEVARWLREEGIGDNILGFSVTDMDGNPTCLERLAVRKIEEYAQMHINAVVIIATPTKFHDEIETNCKKFGFSVCYRVGLEEFSEVKGQILIQEKGKNLFGDFELKKSIYDASWLDLCVEDTYCKFPTLFYRTKDDVWDEVGRWQKSKTYKNIFEISKHIRELPITKDYDVNKVVETMQIYMAFGEREIEQVKAMSLPTWIQPLQVGCVQTKERYGNCFDDLGESISQHNCNLAEMTAAYTIWKNQKGAQYKGLCHYRRHFVLTEQEIMSAKANGIDVILTIPRYVPFGVKNMFLSETPVKEPVYDMIIRAIKECHNRDVDAFQAYMEECFYYPNNMVVAKSEIYDSYCEWIFPVLMRMVELDKETAYGHETDRHVAYAAELLTSFYFMKNKERYRVAVTEYKFEG